MGEGDKVREAYWDVALRVAAFVHSLRAYLWDFDRQAYHELLPAMRKTTEAAYWGIFWKGIEGMEKKDVEEIAKRFSELAKWLKEKRPWSAWPISEEERKAFEADLQAIEALLRWAVESG